MPRSDSHHRRLRGTADGGDFAPIEVGDEFDPKLTRSHKWDVSGCETTPELPLDPDDLYRESLEHLPDE